MAPLFNGRLRAVAFRTAGAHIARGRQNIAKGIRRIDALCEGDIEGTKQFLDVLPQALERLLKA